MKNIFAKLVNFRNLSVGALFFALALPLAGFSRGPVLPVSEIRAQVSQNQAVLVDVREASEVASGMIEGALWFPLSKLTAGSEVPPEMVSQIPGGKNLILYCRSGARSARATEFLTSKNYRAQNGGTYTGLVEGGFKSVLPRP